MISRNYQGNLIWRRSSGEIEIALIILLNFGLGRVGILARTKLPCYISNLEHRLFSTSPLLHLPRTWLVLQKHKCWIITMKVDTIIWNLKWIWILWIWIMDITLLESEGKSRRWVYHQGNIYCSDHWLITSLKVKN